MKRKVFQLCLCATVYPKYLKMKTIIVLISFISFAIAQKNPVLFSSAFDHKGNFYWFVGQTEISSGITTELVRTFYSLGSAGGDLGISAFDSDEGVYYYVNDGSSGALGFRADVFRGSSKVPIGFPLDSVEQLNYDKVKKRLLVAGSDKGEPYLVSFPTDESVRFSYIPDFKFAGTFRTSALDSANQQYYFIAAQQVNISYSDLFLYQSNLNSGAMTSAIKLNCQRMVFPQKMVWDSQRQQLFMFGPAFEGPGVINYYTQQISMAGKCVQKKIGLTQEDTVNAFTYDEKTGLGYVMTSNSNQLINTLYTFNAGSGAIESKAGSGSTARIQSIELVYA